MSNLTELPFSHLALCGGEYCLAELLGLAAAALYLSHSHCPLGLAFISQALLSVVRIDNFL